MNHAYRTLLLATVSIAASSTAHAQASPTDRIRGVNWSGPYIGVQAGVTSVQSKLSGFDENGSDAAGDNDGAWGPLSFPHGNLVGGIYGGYNFRFNNVVLGTEGDANIPTGASSGGNISEDLYPGPGGMFQVTSKWDASIRARLGLLATERLLVFGTGGLTWGRFPAYGGEEIDPTDSFFEQNPNWGGPHVNIGTGGKNSKMGVTFGGGAEYALGNHWKLRGEYRYADYGTANYNYVYDPLGVNTPGVVRHKVTTNRFTVGMAYTFGPDEAGYDGGVEGSSSGVRNWTGFHIGAQVGASATRSRFFGVDNNADNGCEGFCSNVGGGENVGPWSLVPISHMSLLAGLTGGYDLQFSALVVGVEGDVNLESGSAQAYATEDRYPGPGGLWSVKSTWNAGVRARLGLAAGDRALLYGLVGVTFAKFKARGGMEPADDDFYERFPNWGNRDIGGGTRHGLTFGGGIEYALDSRVSFKGEYRTTDFGRDSLSYNVDQALTFCEGNCTFETGRVGSKIRVNSFLFGMNYKIGDPGGTLAATNRSSWTGFHLGAAIGSSRNKVGFRGFDPNSNDTFINDRWGTDEPILFSASGVTLGLYGGYDYQTGPIVLGIEADANYVRGAAESGRLQEQDTPDNGQWLVRAGNWNASLRLRAGALVTPDLLAYVTGGVAYGKVRTTTGFEVSSFDGIEPPPWGFGNISQNGRFGPTVGAGLEYALSEDITLRTEVRRSFYGSKTIHYDSEGVDASITSKLTEDRINLGIGYRFGRHATPPPPPPPPEPERG